MSQDSQAKVHCGPIIGAKDEITATNSGVAAGLAATDPKLVPYGAMTATFYTGLGCLIVPTLLFLIVNLL